VLTDALVELVRQRPGRPRTAAADRLHALLEDAILAQIERLLAPAPAEGGVSLRAP